MSEVPPNVQLVFKLFNMLDVRLKGDVRSMLFLYNVVKKRDIHEDIIVLRGASSKAKKKAILEYSKIALSLYTKNYDYVKAFEYIFISQDDTDVVRAFLEEFKDKLEPSDVNMFIKTSGEKRKRELTYERLKSLRKRVLEEVKVEQETSRFGRKRKPPKNPDFFTEEEIDKAFADDSIADDSMSEWYMVEKEDKTLFYDFEMGGYPYRGRCEFMDDGYTVTALEYGENNQIQQIEPIPIKTLEMHKKYLSEYQKSFDRLKDDAVKARQTFEKVFKTNKYFNFIATMPWDEGKRDFRENEAVIFKVDDFISDGSDGDSQTYSDKDYKPGDTESSDNESDYDTQPEDEWEEDSKRPAEGPAETAGGDAKKLKLNPTQVYKALRKLHIYGKLKY